MVGKHLLKIICVAIAFLVIVGCGSEVVSKELTGRAYAEESDRTLLNSKLVVPMHTDKGYYLAYTVKYSDGSSETTYEKVDKTVYDSHNELEEEKYKP